MKRFISIIFISLFVAMPNTVFAFEPETDCVIDDFNITAELQTDSSVYVQEALDVDCGSLPNKHGILRMLPTKINRDDGIYEKTPITLKSITNQDGVAVPYEVINDSWNNTVTWKIGDPDKTINRHNVYNIEYEIANVVVPVQNKHALHLNLNGSFWELPINNFEGRVAFPEELSMDYVALDVYAGEFGSTNNNLANYGWEDEKTVLITAEEVPKYTGITMWAEFPKGFVELYEPGWWQLYGQYLWWLVPMVILFVVLRIWYKYGKDIPLKGPVVVEYSPPDRFSPLEAEMLEKYGQLSPLAITATIIDLAVRGYIKIKEVPKATWFSGNDWELELIKDNQTGLKAHEAELLNTFFNDFKAGETMRLSSQKYKIPLTVECIKRKLKDNTSAWFAKQGKVYQIIFIVFGIIALNIGLILGTYLGSLHVLLSLVISGILLIIIGLLMSKRTLEGSQLLYHLKGFRRYMRQAERHRMQFYEEKGIFEKYLPYAILFGLTHIWAKAFATALTEKEGASSYLPAWYIAANSNSFNIANFSSAIGQMSSQMNSTISSSSGGGGGFSGGGAGGGGGGSW